MNPKRFLLVIGGILVLAALLGEFALGPTPVHSIFGKYLWFDPAQTLIMLVFGLVALATHYVAKSDTVYRAVAAIIGFLALAAAIIGLINLNLPVPNAGFTNIEAPAEDIIYLALALWGLWVAFMPEGPVFVKEDKAEKAEAAV